MKKKKNTEIKQESSEKTNRLYRISQLIITGLTFIILMAAFIHENESDFHIPIFMTFVVFLISFPSTILSKKLIKYGNTIKNEFARIGYYLFALPIICLTIVLMISAVLNGIFSNIPTPTELGPALGQGLLELFIVLLFALVVFIPYVQTIIVIILSALTKRKVLD